MAEVYVARARSVAGFEKVVALKTIHTRFSADPEFTQLLVDEANITAQLSHRNIVQVIDLGQVDGTHYIAMEYVDGIDLGRLLTTARERKIMLSPRVSAYVAREIADGLEHAHKKNGPDGKPLRIVHRDISPPNVLVSTAGEVKITDFGIAKASLRASKTGTGVVKGKYAYMAPEQAKAQAVDHRADLFALGCVLYELVTGKPVYPSVTLPVLLDRVARVVYEAPERVRPGIPTKLIEVIKKCLAPKVEDRYASARQVADALTDVLFSMPPNPEAELSALVAELTGVASTPSIPPAGVGHSILDDDFDDSTQIESMSVLRSRMVAPLVPGAGAPVSDAAPSTDRPGFRDEATRAFKRVDAPAKDEDDEDNATASMKAPPKDLLSPQERSAPTIAPPRPGAAKVRSPGAASKAGPITRPPVSPPAQPPLPAAPSTDATRREAPTMAPPRARSTTAPPIKAPFASSSASERPAPPPMQKPAGFIAKVAPLPPPPQSAPSIPSSLPPPSAVPSDPPTQAIAHMPVIPQAAPVPQIAQPPAQQPPPPWAQPAPPQAQHTPIYQQQTAPFPVVTNAPAVLAPAPAYDPFAQPAPGAELDLTPEPRANKGILVAAGFAVLGLIALAIVFVVTQ